MPEKKRRAASSHRGVSIIKRRGRFWLRYRISFAPKDYRYRWEALGSHVTTREQAVVYARRKAAELADKRKKNPYQATLIRADAKIGDLIETYKLDFKCERKSREQGDPGYIERTEKRLDHHLKPFAERFAALRCERLTPQHLEAFAGELADSSLRVASSNRLLDAARALLRFGIRKGFLYLDDAQVDEALKRRKNESSGDPRILKLAELKALIRALGEHDTARWYAGRDNRQAYGKDREASGALRHKPLAPFIALALLTGCRPGEIERLKGDDVVTEWGSIRVAAGKTGRGRPVPWHDSPLLAEFAAALKLRSGGGLLVGKVKRARLVQLGKLAGIDDLNRQVLRRTHVSHVASGSTDPERDLCGRFGHTTDVSIRYYRAAMHEVRKRGDTVEAWLGVEAELRTLLVGLGYITRDSGDASVMQESA